MTLYTSYFRPILTLAGALAVLLAALGATAQSVGTCSTSATCESPALSKFEQDRRAILGMAGEYEVSFDFKETVAVRQGYELKKPYHSEASELIVVIEDAGDFISLQHLLVVRHDGEAHVIKHWRQDWRYESSKGYDFQGDNVWKPVTYGEAQTRGAWVQSVFQVDDSPRYWGVGQWAHRDGVSTWTSGPTHRPLPRREFSKRDDYNVLGAVNTHVVTADGWVHCQNNYKLDKSRPEDAVIALESGVNTYTKTTETDFSAARERWEKTGSYWAEVRAAWAEVYQAGETIKLRNKWKGDPMYTHFFDLEDLYWDRTDAEEARAEIKVLIDAFIEPDQVTQPSSDPKGLSREGEALAEP